MNLTNTTSIKIMTYNISAWTEKNIEKHEYLIGNLIKERNADIVFLNEINNNINHLKRISKIANYPNYYKIESYPHHPKKIAIGFLCKLNVIKYYVLPVLEYNSKLHNALKIKIKIGKNILNVYGLHCWNYDHMNKNLFEIFKIELKKNNPRVSQILKIINDISKQKYPSIFLGDLNTFPFSKAYNIISKNLKDSCPKHLFFKGTYLMKYIRPRLDYIFHTKDIISSKYKIIKKRISDHFPIEVNILLQK